jgi:hypothetical protein
MKLLFNIAFHHQTNGQTEKGQWGVKLIPYNVDKQDWVKHLSMAKFSYNSTMHSVTEMSPFKLTLGRKAKKLMDLAIPMG